MKRKVFLFDVDGTLTPPRGVITTEFEHFLSNFSDNYSCFLVTGSDRAKTIKQIGNVIYDKMKKVYQCYGNEIWSGNTILHKNIWEPPKNLIKDLEVILSNSNFTLKTGHHIDYRTGMINFSVLGRNSNSEQRKSYYHWDKINKEREKIIDFLSCKYSNIEFIISGQIGIDISINGTDKSKILSDFDFYDSDIYFFGDSIYPGGNDFSIALEVDKRGGCYYSVTSWIETFKNLENIIDKNKVRLSKASI